MSIWHFSDIRKWKFNDFPQLMVLNVKINVSCGKTKTTVPGPNAIQVDDDSFSFSRRMYVSIVAIPAPIECPMI